MGRRSHLARPLLRGGLRGPRLGVRGAFRDAPAVLPRRGVPHFRGAVRIHHPRRDGLDSARPALHGEGGRRPVLLRYALPSDASDGAGPRAKRRGQQLYQPDRVHRPHLRQHLKRRGASEDEGLPRATRGLLPGGTPSQRTVAAHEPRSHRPLRAIRLRLSGGFHTHEAGRGAQRAVHRHHRQPGSGELRAVPGRFGNSGTRGVPARRGDDGGIRPGQRGRGRLSRRHGALHRHLRGGRGPCPGASGNRRRGLVAPPGSGGDRLLRGLSAPVRRRGAVRGAAHHPPAPARFEGHFSGPQRHRRDARAAAPEGGAAERARFGRACEPGEIDLPHQHVPRLPHAHELHLGLRVHRAGPPERHRSCARLPAQDHAVQRSLAEPGERHFGCEPHRERQDVLQRGHRQPAGCRDRGAGHVRREGGGQRRRSDDRCGQRGPSPSGHRSLAPEPDPREHRGQRGEVHALRGACHRGAH